MAKFKKLFSGICICLMIAGIIGTTTAFFTAFDRSDNLIGVGYNESVIEEEFPSPSPAIPGQNNTYTKKVTVKNNDSVPCYIRVSVAFSDSHIGAATSLTGLNTTDWDFCSEEEDTKLGGYYYYKKVLAPGESSSPLFEGIKISSDADFSFSASGDTFDVIVYEESVQCGSYTSYTDAWNHFIRE